MLHFCIPRDLDDEGRRPVLLHLSYIGIGKGSDHALPTTKQHTKQKTILHTYLEDLLEAITAHCILSCCIDDTLKTTLILSMYLWHKFMGNHSKKPTQEPDTSGYPVVTVMTT